jgi:hypothetical protein
MNVLELRNNLASLDIPKKVEELNQAHSEEFLQANRDQMWDGKKPSGSDITPSYLNDPYFKTRKAADGYAKWKAALTPNPKRNKYAPNLYINGYFYSTLLLNPKEFRIEVKDSFGSKVAKSHSDALGVSTDNLKAIANRGYLKEFYEYFEKTTGLKVN